MFRASPFNFARQWVRGIDFDAGYRVALSQIFGKGTGDFTLHGLATRYIHNITDSGIANVTPIDAVGQLSGISPPKWIYRVNAGYENEHFSVTSTVRGVSSGTYGNQYIVCNGNCPVGRPAAIVSQFPTIDSNHVSGAAYVDLNLTAKIKTSSGARGEVFLNVTNLLDRDPILIPETGLAANSTYSDLLGRAFRVGVRFEMK